MFPAFLSCHRMWRRLAVTGLVALSAMAAVQAQTHRAQTLGSGASVPGYKAVNSLGQVGYNEGLFSSSGLPCPRGSFFDGSSSVDIGSLGGGCTRLEAVSDAGHVVGASTLAGDHWPHRAFLWTRSGGMVYLGTLGGSESVALDVNAAGQVTGWSRTHGDVQVHAFFWSAGTGMIDLGTLGGAYAMPNAINASGQVAVTSTRSDGLSAAFVWSPDGTKAEINPATGVLTAVADLNDAGQAVGSWTDPQGVSRSYVWHRSSGMTDLGVFGGTAALAFRINASGGVLGSFTRSDGVDRAFVWTAAAGMTDLGALAGTAAYTYAYDINRYGTVVGRSLGSDSLEHGFVWTAARGMQDVDTWIQNLPADLETTPVRAISDSGVMIASGALLLSPTATAPVVGEVLVDDPLAAGRSAGFSASFTDPDSGDIHTALWSWGDGSPNSVGAVSESAGTGSVSATHSFAAAGVYNVTLTITDSSGQKAASSRQVTVYDASRGFVTGSGWLRSPLGAVKSDPTEGGRARFAFVSRYVAGESRPPGRTLFQLHGAELHFRGQTQGPVTLNGQRAHYSGTGRLNGVEGYQFSVTAIDGDLPGGRGRDRLRLRIWHTDRNGATVVDYDNQLNPSLAGTLREGSVVQRGRVVIRSRAD